MKPGPRRDPLLPAVGKNLATGNSLSVQSLVPLQIFCSLRAPIMAILAICAMVIVLPSHALSQEPDESKADESLLPPVSGDQVILKPKGAARPRILQGAIADLKGHSVILRQNDGQVEVVVLRDVHRIEFSKSVDYETGLQAMQQRKWLEAIKSLTAAHREERRPWVRREILGAMAQCYRARREFAECLRTVEQILADDPSSRHVLSLPLVWDERLPAAQRYSADVAQLRSKSLAERLTAASALLSTEEHRRQATATLQSVRKESDLTMSQLAELQLWRLKLIEPEKLAALEVEDWQRRLKELDRRVRSPGEFLAGRALMQLHENDRAITCLLWMPLMEPWDPPTTAASLTDALTLFEQSGRSAEGQRLLPELESLQMAISVPQ